ncbi:MAG: hypothetical protein IJT87_11435 [Ruminiclostridium sp.]|nr:hypothetical protein [Ruminiclostridium sp.]
MDIGTSNKIQTAYRPLVRGLMRASSANGQLTADEEMTPFEKQRAMEQAAKEQQKAAEEQRRKQAEEQAAKQKEQEQKMLEEELKSSKEEAEAMEDMFESFAKCIKIAARITKGDIVPMKDIKYLAEHEPDMYKQAILMRMPNDHPKKHKSLIKDEDEASDDTMTAEEAGADESASDTAGTCEAAPAAETDEEAG